MEESSQRILVEAAYNGVIRREESSLRRIPHSSLPVPKFAAKILPCSAPQKPLDNLSDSKAIVKLLYEMDWIERNSILHVVN